MPGKAKWLKRQIWDDMPAVVGHIHMLNAVFP